MKISEKEIKSTAFTLPDFNPAKVGPAPQTDAVLSDAHRIAIDEMVPLTEVFFIQLASMSAVKPNYYKFKPLLRFGNVYRIKIDTGRDYDEIRPDYQGRNSH